MMKKRKTKKKKTLINKIKKWLHTKDGKEQQEINKQLVVIIVSIFITVITVIGVTYSAFVWSDNSEKNQNIVAGNVVLSISSTSGELGSGLDYPVPESSESSLEPYTFTIKNDGSLSASYKLRIVSNNSTENTLDTEYIYMSLDGGKTISRTSLKNFENYPIDQGALEPNETKTYNLRLWIVGDAPNSVIGGTWNGKIVLESSQTTPGEPNEPILANGMIPVIYDETNDVWKVANTSSEWYNYDKQMWANAVTTSVASYRTASPGTSIPMDVINSMWVWIPRFKYKITSGIGSSSSLYNPPQINVVFEEGTSSTGVSEATYRAGIGTDGTNTNYYTHPIFRNGTTVYNTSAYDIGGWDRELTGIWVGKFETATTNETCNATPSVDNCLDVEPIIKPNVQALRYQIISTRFITSLKFAGGTMDTSAGEVTYKGNSNYGLVSGTDTHMMKNTEWGAVAILSQSQYGKMGNSDFTSGKKEIYENNSLDRYTGRSLGGTPASGSATTYGNYSYNDMTCGTESVECTGTKVEFAGTGASTTGTIYGIYDMSGGAFEYVMGNWASTTGSSGFTTYPPSKYYDLYNGTSSTDITKEKAILGDATWETMKWYYDYAAFVVDSQPWFSRGSQSQNGGSTGIYYTTYNSGGGGNYSFHTVLIP